MKTLLQEKCPICDKRLDCFNEGFMRTVIIKSCSEGHYEKVFHPALETFIETRKIS
ncbi:hypothetical protein [Bacillus sp. Marseille-Q3570]|uniref:hypothetical protein n=1 Tax=Bacillus sp. Marseille-Q3570 TaxID=2963522 RepID=UPI0021B727C9|nr:hypothetical protein [Bacillus sp. Marseille-Q3570]